MDFSQPPAGSEPPTPDASETPVSGPPPRESGDRSLRLAWGLLAGLIAGTVLVHHASAAPSLLVGAAVAMPAVWLAALGVLAALGLQARRLAVGSAFLVAGTVFGAVWGRAWVGRPQMADGPPLRVLAWNVQRLGWEQADDGVKLACVAGHVDEADPDALVLSEVTEDDVVRLSRRLGLDCAYTDYYGTGEKDEGGLAVCARGGRWRLGEMGPRRFVEAHDWYYVFAELVRAGAPAEPAEGEVFNLIGVHLQPYGGVLGSHVSHVSEAQSDETRALLARVARLRDPTVVAGDFNSPRDTPVHVAMRGYLTDTFEQAGWGPGHTALAGGWLPMRIDYIYASPELAVQRAEHPAWNCSDHLPVLSDLRLSR